MTEEQILKMVKEHFQEGGVRDDGSSSEYYGETDAFVKFALAIHENGYNKGYDKGYANKSQGGFPYLAGRFAPFTFQAF